MDCSFDSCRDSILLGILAPIVICVIFYVGLLTYTMYLTDKYHTTDIKHWRNQRLSTIAGRYASEIRGLNREIRQLGGDVEDEPKPKSKTKSK